MLQNLIARYRRWRIAKHPIPDRLWTAGLRAMPYARSLSDLDRARLRDLATQFIFEKRFFGAHGFEPTEAMQVRIAIKACVPILALDLDYYAHFKGVVVYPGDFRVNQQQMDDIGVLHEHSDELCGQSLDQGPIVLSWERIATERSEIGQDLVIHECAHKLDILNGDADGFPPLPHDASPKRWAKAFSAAYDGFCNAVDAEKETRLDPYASEDAAEFFAVASETFFTRPDILFEDFPDVYSQLVLFYRQDPYTVMKR
jgi:Mlc titration factor MtfA (ptsG expression regulator)